MYGELKKRMELHKNVISYLEQILEAALQEKELHGHLTPITITIQESRTKHAGHCGRHIDRPARIYLRQLLANTGFNLKDLPGAMDNRVSC